MYYSIIFVIICIISYYCFTYYSEGFQSTADGSGSTYDLSGSGSVSSIVHANVPDACKKIDEAAKRYMDNIHNHPGAFLKSHGVDYHDTLAKLLNNNLSEEEQKELAIDLAQKLVAGPTTTEHHDEIADEYMKKVNEQKEALGCSR